MLQIKTNSEKDTDARLNIRFCNASTTSYDKDLPNYLRLKITFSDNIKYSIYHCMGASKAFTSLPEGREKTWGIRKWDDKIMIFCNGELVLEYSVPVDHECYNDFNQPLKWVVFRKEINGVDDNASLAYKASPQHGN